VSFRHRHPSRRAGIVLGIGLGGLVDGIVLHQLMHWHSMLSARVPPTTMDALLQNMRADGAFHAGVWCVTLLGVYLLRADAWRDTRGDLPVPGVRAFTGQLLTGWGAFNVVEGTIDHHVLQLHHVRDLPTHVPELDWVFLLVGGAGFLLFGWNMQRGPVRR
jgi:uncharacterized membrane protein